MKINNVIVRINYLAQLLTLFIFGYIVVTHIFRLISLDMYVDPKVFDLIFLRSLVSLAFVTSMTSLLISIRYGSTKFISFLNLAFKDKLTHLFISALLGYFLAINDVPPDLMQIVTFVVITCFYLLLLPSLIQSYAQFNFLQ